MIRPGVYLLAGEPEPRIDWEGSCCNLAPAAMKSTLHSQLVHAHAEGSACTNVWRSNLGYKLRVSIPSSDHEPLNSIPGVPGVGRPI